MIQVGAFFDDADFFIQRLHLYPYIAQAPVKAVKPPNVAGEHMSVRLRTGWRLWGFQTDDERNRFLAAYTCARPFPE